ncbi:MAG: hypothetical protein GW762_05970 [Candidatus Pacebacteria bacterium]|nr:hypothetical protein [Candidatus Paceibacterota bacterium]PIR64091.1 MAG: hypothetical protein COU64_00885 [Candidatus Pacebacteria bacterium CG10_big_fil_rev_8_21_14_0_10_40_26]PIZ78443.1 MAG: hypothetical protein COY01_04265 [Candidatus Pacebacteria bacterium CG_4_10_14_0_2_um_filter_40_20]PJA69293.1 MAG: hypothetical protein CO156_00150 [Candidatus Pacebacteria bacterium CG_4_9_14_3_um_filter_40_12]PJC41976.1 MAG: hypothetical protein CO041_01705 [Candidatus Pacebacteria bacterium CG_4_9_
MKSLFYAFSWIFLATGSILTIIAGWHFYSLNPELFSFSSELNGITVVETSLDEKENYENNLDFKTYLEAGDARPLIIANFLERYDSPLKPYDYYGVVIVEIADKYDIDFRLLPAIAMQESNLCKRIPEGSYNCLGFGIHERGTLGFENYEANFERAARELKAYYIDQGRVTPELIMKKYTPSSDGSWARSVNQWMSEMRYDDRVLGKEKRTDAYLLEFTSEGSGSAEATTAAQNR